MKTIKINIHRWLNNLSQKLILFLEDALSKRLSAGGYDFDGALEEMNRKLEAAPFIEPVSYTPINAAIREAVEEMYVINGGINGTLNDIHELLDDPFFEAFNNPHGIMEQLELIRLDKYQINNDVGISFTTNELQWTSATNAEMKPVTRVPEKIGLRDLMNNDILAGLNGVPSFTEKYRAQFDALQEMNAIDDDVSFNDFLDMLLKRSDIVHKVEAGWFSNVTSDILTAALIMPAIVAVIGENPLTGEVLSDEERQQAAFDTVINIGIFAASVVTGGFAGAKAYGASIAGSMQKSFWANTVSSMAGGASSLVAVGVLDEMGAPKWVQTIGALTSSTVVGSGVGRKMSSTNAPVGVVDNWSGIDNSDIRALNRIDPNNMTGADWNIWLQHQYGAENVQWLTQNGNNPFFTGWQPSVRSIRNTHGTRNEIPLTELQIQELVDYAESLGMPRDRIIVADIDGTNPTGIMFEHTLVINNDALPAVGDNLPVNSRITGRATIAHEVVGHYEAGLAGRSFEVQNDIGSSMSTVNPRNFALDESQASIRAARFAPDLSAIERYDLIRDGLTRLHDAGLRLCDVRELLHISTR